MGATQQSVFDRLLAFEQQCLEHRPQAQAGGEGDYWDGVVYRLNEYHLTSSIREIEEIISPGDIIPVPGSKPWLLGLANVRGNLTTIVDLGGYLFGQRSPMHSSSRLLLTSLQNRPMALLVDEVFGQRHFSENQSTTLTEQDSSAVAEQSDEEQSREQRLTEGWVEIADFIEREFHLENRHWGVFSIGRLCKLEAFLDGAA